MKRSLAMLFVICFLFFIPPVNEPLKEVIDSPRVAISVAVNSTWPASGAILDTRFPISPYNFTSIVQNASTPYNEWDSVNLLVTYSGATYSNTTATTGNYNYGGDSPNNIWFDSFQNDADGATPSGIAIPSSGNQGGTCTVLSSYVGHQKVAKATSASGKWGDMSFDLGVNVQGTSITFSGWFNVPAGINTMNVLAPCVGDFDVNTAANRLFEVGVAGTNFFASDGGSSSNLAVVSVDTWYHYRAVMSTAAQTYDVYLDGSLEASGFAFRNTLYYANHWGQTGYKALAQSESWYFDALSVTNVTRLENTWDCLNASFSSPLVGSYSYQFQAWDAGTRYDCPSVPFILVQASPNVQIISESNRETSWVLLPPTVSWTSLFASAFDTQQWTIGTLKNWTFYSEAIADARISSGSHDTAFGLGTSLTIYNKSGYGEPEWRFLAMFPNSSLSYLMDTANITQIQVYKTYIYSYPVNRYLVFNATWFDEPGVTWDTSPVLGTLFADNTITFPSGSAWVTFDFNPGINFTAGYSFTIGAVQNTGFGGLSREGGGTPRLYYNVANFYNKSGLIYVQANTSETLTLTSPILSDINLGINDRVTVTFNTTSTRQINLNLKHAGSMVEDLILSESPNYEFGTQTKTFAIMSAMTIDQLEFTGAFEDMENLQITSITIGRPVGYSSYYVAPYSEKLITLDPAIYAVTVFDHGDLVMSETLVVTLDLVTITYSPFSGGERRVSFFTPSGQILDFYQFRCNLTRTYNNFTASYNLTVPTFYADDGSTFYLNITDRFGNKILNYTDYVATFIDITLTNVYSLKIQNQMRTPSLLQLTRNSITQSEYAMVGEIVEYTLWNGTYELNYSQSELGTNISINLDVTSAAIYNISSVYHTAYITAWSLAGDARAFTRLYVNGTRREYGPIETLGETSVVVLDYTNDTQYSQVLNLSTTAELDIFVYLAHLGMQNLDRNQSAQVSVYKGSILLMAQQIGYGGYLDWYATNGTYAIVFDWANGTSETQYQLVSSSATDLTTYSLDFGFYAETPTPDFVPSGLWETVTISLVILVGIMAIVMIYLWVKVNKNQTRREGVGANWGAK